MLIIKMVVEEKISCNFIDAYSGGEQNKISLGDVIHLMHKGK